MSPFAKYIDCVNCGNELISIHELSFRTPDTIVCDFCGQPYPGLSRKIRNTKTIVNFIFIILALLVWALARTMGGFSTALFALFPVYVMYYFTMGAVIRRITRFLK